MRTLLEKYIRMVLEAPEKEEETEDGEYFFHVTYYNRLPSISSQGIVPNAPASSSGNYEHKQGKVFFTEASGISFWYGRAQEWAENRSDETLDVGFVPIVLRFFVYDEFEEDEVGSSDANARAFMHDKQVEAEEIEIWNGVNWIPVYNYDQIDPGKAIEDNQFKNPSPLEP